MILIFCMMHFTLTMPCIDIGSNVITYPEAAQRALSDGHTICAHTWSHKQMTTLTNEEIVAEMYWTHKAIKEVLGITPKCWRPPYGDVDDRVRSIVWQMGMSTIIWDQDSNDWNLVRIHDNVREHAIYHFTISMVHLLVVKLLLKPLISTLKTGSPSVSISKITYMVISLW